MYSSNDTNPLLDEDIGCATDADDNSGGTIPQDVLKDIEVSYKYRCYIFTLEIATEADYEMSSAFIEENEDAESANLYILSVLNQVEGAYATMNTRFSITYQQEYVSNTDPYDDDWNISDHLWAFTDNWNTNRADVHRDVAHLFMGKTGPRGGSGVAPLGGKICTDPDAAYSVSKYIREPNLGQINIAAHEIAHNLNGTHEPDKDPDNRCPDPNQVGAGPIMCATVRKVTFFFSNRSRAEIYTYIHNYAYPCMDRQDFDCGRTDIRLSDKDSISELLCDENNYKYSISKAFSTNDWLNTKSSRSQKNVISTSIYNLTGQLLSRKNYSTVDNTTIDWIMRENHNPVLILHITYDDGSSQIMKLVF